MRIVRSILVTVAAAAVLLSPAPASATTPDDTRVAGASAAQPAALDAGVLEAPPGRYCNIYPPTGTVCLYAHHNAAGWSAHYSRCGAADIPSWLDPGNPDNNGVSSYWDEQTGGAYLVGYRYNSAVFDTRNKHHTVNLVNGNDKAYWVRVC